MPQCNISDHKRKENAGNKPFSLFPKREQSNTDLTGKRDKVTAFANTKRNEKINT